MAESKSELDKVIENVSDVVGQVWPLYSFVTANPLSGFEDQPFPEAVEEAEGLLGGHGYPTSEQFRQAWENHRIEADFLLDELVRHDIDLTPQESLEYLESEEPEDFKRNRGWEERKLDQLLVKWLSVFLDEGQTIWSMPGREQGFYQAWKQLVPHDTHVPELNSLESLPDTRQQAVLTILDRYGTDKWSDIITYHLTCLPGWTGYIKQRNNRGDDPWQESYPIDLVDYLAVRLILADHLDARLYPDEDVQEPHRHDHSTRDAWLKAWEKSYRRNLLKDLKNAVDQSSGQTGSNRPDAQLVFCIDTRSEIIRRHIEATGHYETFGYAGFFGIPMRYQGFANDFSIDACPPIVSPKHRITDIPRPDREDQRRTFEDWRDLSSGIRSMMKSVKNNVLTAFNFVEGAGSFYGLSLVTKTLFPKAVFAVQKTIEGMIPSYDEFTRPDLDGNAHENHDHDLKAGLDFEDRVAYAESAFRLMGWTDKFAQLVVFTGHSSKTTNNPFDSSLDCGACAGNPGGPNARVLAQICNQQEVREALNERGISIPDDTYFLAGEHNTTTDEIDLYTDVVPDQYRNNLEELVKDLRQAQETSTAERVETFDENSDSPVESTQKRSADWAQTRPEWGLAGNASFIIGPRDLTKKLDFEGRSFLHAYDWETDPYGDALENIMAGPLVVTQWINNQYYFATVNNGFYGSGSKVTQNPVGNFGVFQGNESDLMSGLPLQSLKASDRELYHQPIRLSAIIHAPMDIVNEKLHQLEKPKTLVENEWISLSVLDPHEENQPYRFKGEKWKKVTFDTVSEHSEPAVTSR